MVEDVDRWPGSPDGRGGCDRRCRTYWRSLTGEGLEMIRTDGGDGITAALPFAHPDIPYGAAGPTMSPTNSESPTTGTPNATSTTS